MFNKEFIKNLKLLNTISDKVLIKYPITVLNSDSGDIIVNINSQKFSDSEFENIPIYELNKFLNLLSLFNNYEIKHIDNHLEISETQKFSIFNLADEFLMKQYDKSPEIINGLEKYPTVGEFKLDLENFQNFKKASNIFGELNTLQFESFDNNIIMSLNGLNRFEQNNSTYKYEYLNVSNKNFKINISIENFNKLPNEEYLVKIKYNKEKDAYRIIFENANFVICIATII